LKKNASKLGDTRKAWLEEENETNWGRGGGEGDGVPSSRRNKMINEGPQKKKKKRKKRKVNKTNGRRHRESGLRGETSIHQGRN